MKQRLAIARAILTKPELLILDEPINALDPEGIREMRELFRKLNTDYGITIFISSHILSEVEQIADTIGVIQSGKLMKEISMSDVHKFQTDYVEVEVDNIELAGYVLEHECGIRNFKIVSENRIEIYDLGKAVKEISALLVQNGVGINSIGRKQNSLSSSFMANVLIKSVYTRFTSSKYPSALNNSFFLVNNFLSYISPFLTTLHLLRILPASSKISFLVLLCFPISS